MFRNYNMTSHLKSIEAITNSPTLALMYMNINRPGLPLIRNKTI